MIIDTLSDKKYNVVCWIDNISGKVIKEFNNPSDCANFFGINREVVNHVASGRNLTSYGKIFIYKNLLTEQNITKRIQSVKNYINLHSRSVLKIDVLTTKIICEYDSAYQCNELTKIPSGVINKCCKGMINYIGNYIFMYSDEYSHVNCMVRRDYFINNRIKITNRNKSVLKINFLDFN